jgi:hypothetical protein
VRILLFHVHGSWTTAFVQGSHEYVLPVLPDRSADGRGRAQTWDWPASVVERSPAELAEEPIDAVVLQRPQDAGLVHRWTGRQPGVDVPAIYLEHNAPEPHPVGSRHPLAEQRAIPIVHVTHFNALFWDTGHAPVRVIEHGIVDPGELYSGELARSAVVINEPMRRGRMVGTDLLPGFLGVGPVDLFGMAADSVRSISRSAPGQLETYVDLKQSTLHQQLARRRIYIHPMRWTSLGLSLIEAMQLGMPVVAVAATEVNEAVPAAAGVVSTDLRVLHTAVRTYLQEPELARMAGKAARAHALERYGLHRFLSDWDALLKEVVR